MVLYAEPASRKSGPATDADRISPAALQLSQPGESSSFQRLLDHSPRIQSQRRLRRMLADSPAVKRQEQLSALIVPTPDAGVGQRVAARSDDAAPVPDRARRPRSTAALRTALMTTTSLTPIQGAFWDWVPTLGTVASVLGAGYAGMQSGAALGGLTGPLGGTIGAAVGGLAGVAGGLYGAYRGGVTGAGTVAGLSGGAYAGAMVGNQIAGPIGAIVGGAGGALAGGAAGALGGATLQDVAPPRPQTRLTSERIPSLGTVTFRRAVDKAMAEGHEDMAALKKAKDYLDDPKLKDFLASDRANVWLSKQSPERKKEWPLLIVELIDKYYQEQDTAAKPGDYKADQDHASAVHDVLENDAFIKTILEGRLNAAPQLGALEIPDAAPSEVRNAAGTFNKLVSRKLPKLPGAKRSLAPISGINRESGLHLGWASPAGAALHEMGHFLEYNLEPSEFATVHNFLRARSESDRRRRVGYQALAGGQQSETGYNIDLPDLAIPHPPSLAKTVGSALAYPFSAGGARERAAAVLDRAVVAHGNRPETSYASQVYETSYDTEFLSTTIHFFSDPEFAQQLVRSDPLRVCLFLSFANPEVYQRVRETLAERDPRIPDLNRLIHKVTPDKGEKSPSLASEDVKSG